MKRNLKKIVLFLLIAAVLTSSYPAASATAKKKGHQKDWEEDYDEWEDYYGDWEDFHYNQEDWTGNQYGWNQCWQNWYEFWQEQMKDNGWNYYSEDIDSYLVLVAQPNGTYLAYEDISYLNSRKQLVVETKPISKALGISYKQLAGNKKKRTVKYTDLKNFNLSFKYFNTKKDAYYQFMGFRGVIVYSAISKVTGLPSLNLVTNLEDNPWYQQNNNNNNNNNTTVTNIIVKPTILYHGTYSEYRYTEAMYQSQQTTVPLQFNLSEVYAAFAADGLPSTGVFGSGHCDTAITLQGYNSSNNLIGEIKTSPGEFLIDFPSATQLKVLGETRNLFLDFTPVKPIVLTNTTSLAITQIGWLYPKDSNARQYFLLADHMKLTPVGLNCAYDYSRRKLNPKNMDDVNNAATWQRVTVILRHYSYEAFPSGSCLNAEKIGTGTAPYINNSRVLFQSTGNAALASDYPTKLIQMVDSVNKVGLNTYFPSKNFERQLVIKLPDGTKAASTYAFMNLDPSYLNLDNMYDYYYSMHEMVHFYEATQNHYGFRFPAWTEGNAATLTVRAMDQLGISYYDATGMDLIAKKFETNFSFLTPDNRKNFEAYYLNVTGDNAALVGYHFTRFLQDFYGYDVVYRIMQKVYDAKIPFECRTNSTCDKLFTDCIKSVTSPDVFNQFIKFRVEQK